MRKSDPFHRPLKQQPRQVPRRQAGAPGSAGPFSACPPGSPSPFSAFHDSNFTVPPPLLPQTGRGVMPVAAFSEAASRIQEQTAAAEAERARELSLHAAATNTSPTTTSVPGPMASPTQAAGPANTSMSVTTTDSNTAGQVPNTPAVEPTLQSIFAPYMAQTDTHMTSAEDSTVSDIITTDVLAPAPDISASATPLNINTTTTSSLLDNARALQTINERMESRMIEMAQEARENQQRHDMNMNYQRGLEQAGRDKDSRIKDLESELAKREKGSEENSEDIDKLLLACQQADNALSSSKDEVSRLTQELSESQATVQAQTSVYQETVTALKEEAFAKVADLEEQISNLQQGVAQQTDADKNQLLARNHELEVQLSSHANELAQLRSQAQAQLQEDHNTIMILEGQRNEAQNLLETASSDLARTRNERSALQVEHDGLIGQYGEVQRSRDEQAEQIVDQRRRNDDALARTTAVEAERETLRQTVANLEEKLTTSESAAQASVRAYEDAVRHILDLDNKISEHQQQEQAWRARDQLLQSTQEQLDESVREVSQLTENAERIEDIKEVYKEKMGTLERASASKDTRIRKLEAELAASLQAANNEEENRPGSSHTYVSRTLSPVHGSGFGSLAAELAGFSPLVSPNRQQFEHSQDDMLDQGSQTTVQELDFSKPSTVIDQAPLETPATAASPIRQTLSFSNTMVVADEEPVEPTVDTALPIRQQLGFSGISTLLDEEPVEPQVIVRTVSRPRQQLGPSGTSTVLNEEPIEQQVMPARRPLQQLGFRRPRTLMTLTPMDPEGWGLSPPKVKPVEPKVTKKTPRTPRQRLGFARPQTILSEAPVDAVLPPPQILPGRISYIARSPVGRFADKYCPSPIIPALLFLLFLITAWNWFTISVENASWLASNELARSSIVQQRADGAGIIYAYGPAQWLLSLVRAIVVFFWTLPTPMSVVAVQGKMFGLAAEVGYGSSVLY